ncbi:MAG: Eco57I restriction-modification methylase domain-containing protein [Chloroflexi bacterium]|nr:Eco57I restriction-modification methylase domain-containing protein [Chloroflexota bacterium]
MKAPDIIKNLVERFENNRESYRSGKYNETQLRREFLDPFFDALGWDVFNKGGYAETYKDVIHEDSLEIEGENKAPDYAFRIGGMRKFFVEAKKPAVNIEFNIHPAFQLRRYAWSAKLPLGILTDFEEFAVYDCRTKPDKKDKASLGRIALYSYKDYIEKWDEIAAIFSRDAVLKGSFDQYAEGLKSKKGTTEVDDAFLAEIERWRDLLAKNIALRNPSLNVRELNYAVQITIDRIIFLRICEDRGVERDEQLKEISAGKDVYAGLCALFKKADARYNSGLFHFKDEKEQSGVADSLTLSLNLDDKVLQDILKNLYYPESPYVFREIPSDILGQVYERFLGKVIRLTAGHQAKVEEKPEVRKAGGVYYTPTYIVEYIVQNTVGKLMEGKTPKEVARLKVLDPACGSGTFPLGAFQYLLDWHLKWYADADNSPEKWMTGKNPAIYQVKDGYRLTTAKKKEILLNNIFGVDIDAQAVEVTKLSLLLKVLEGESSETIGSQLALFQERVLPDLGRNIKCGNSLIGPDYYEGQQLTLGINYEEERYRVNAFDWRGEFSDVFIHGGFDVVIGNPPYVRQESLSEYKEYFQRHYKSYDGVADLYIYFIEKGISVLRKEGLYSIIVSSSFLRATYGKALRTYLQKNATILRLVDFGGLAVFENAKDTYVCIPLILADGLSNQDVEICRIPSLNLDLSKFVKENIYTIPVTQFTQEAWAIDNAQKLNLFNKIKSNEVELGKYVAGQFFRGVTTGLNDAFVIDTPTKDKLIASDPKCSEIIKPLLQGEDIRRWHTNYKNRWLIFTRRGVNIDSYPAIKEHLSNWKDELTPKQNKTQKKGRKPGRYKWYEIQDEVAYYPVFDGPKIIYPDIAKGPRFFFDTEGHYLSNTGYAIGTKDLYLLGLLNSKIFWFLISNISIPFGVRAGEYRYRLISQYMEKIPIHSINFSDPTEKAMHDKVVSLVERMLALHKQSPRSPQESDIVKREIESTDKAIDRLVYELYGLSEEEIKIVEQR